MCNDAPPASQPKSFKLRWYKADLDKYHRITEILLSKVDIDSIYSSAYDSETCYNHFFHHHHRVYLHSVEFC